MHCFGNRIRCCGRAQPLVRQLACMDQAEAALRCLRYRLVLVHPRNFTRDGDCFFHGVGSKHRAWNCLGLPPRATGLEVFQATAYFVSLASRLGRCSDASLPDTATRVP